MLFDVRTLSRGDWDVVRVVGDVDLATLPTLRSELDRAESSKGALDLSSVDLFDPLGFGVVLAGVLRARRRGAVLVVVAPPGRPRELSAEARVDQLVTVAEPLDALDDLP